MSSVRQKMAAVQKAVNKAEERLRLGEEPIPAVVEEKVEDKVEEVAQPAPEKKAEPKKKAAPKAKAKAKSAPKGKKS